MSPIVYIVVIAYLVLAIYIGYRTSRSVNAADYMAAGRSQPYWVVGSGYVAEYMSMASFLGMAGLVYNQGFMPNGSYIGSVIGYIGGIAFFGPLFRRFGQFTIPDFLGDRYDSNWVRAASGLLIFIGYFLYISVQLMGVAFLFELLFGLPFWAGVIIAGGVVVLYTILGGMLATAYTDVFQLAFKWTAGIIILVLSVNKGGGIFNIIDQTQKLNPNFLTIDNGTGNPWTIWTFIIIWIIGGMARADTVSRAYGAKNEREVYKAIIFCTPFIWVSSFMFFCYGMIGKSLIPGIKGLDAQNIYLIMAQEWAPPIITGLAFAGLLATAQSVASGQLMVSSLAIGRDIYGKIIGPLVKKRPISDDEMVKATRYVMVVLAILTFGFAMAKITWMTLITNISASIMGPAFLVTWLGGFFYKKATKYGAISALIIGGVSAIYTSLTNFSIPGAPWLVPPLFCLIITTISFFVGSLFGKPSEKSLLVYEKLKKNTEQNDKKSITGLKNTI